MRFISHWNIARDVAGEKSNLVYLLGSIFPDYVERFTRHRTNESLDIIEDRINQISSLKDGVKKQYLIGTVMHYLCDYCCYAHSDKYFELIHHRIFECKEQKFHIKNSRDIYIKRMNRFIEQYENIDLQTFIKERNEYIEQLNIPKWWKDFQIMELDLSMAYCLCKHTYNRF